MDSFTTATLFMMLGGLILLSAYFSSSETGMMSINRYRLKHLQKEGHKAANRVQNLLERPDRLIGIILIGNNLVNVFASMIAAELGMRFYDDYGVLVAGIVLTFILLIFAEVTPKTLAALYPEKVAFPSSMVLSPLLRVSIPFVIFLNYITNGILKLFKVDTGDSENHSLSKEELRTVVHESGVMIPKKHQDMLMGILDLEKVTAEDIMVPRNEIFGIDINDDWKDIQKQLTNAQHTRVLVFRDNIDDAVGFIHMRDALRLLSKDEFSKASLLRAVREIHFTPEKTPLHTLLYNFQSAKERIGLAVDEYGDIQGLVTLEDILEEIVGDFTTSIVEAKTEKETRFQPDGTFLLDASTNIRDINKEMDWVLPTDGPKTINGLVLEYLEDIPQHQISFRLAGYPMEIVEMQDNKIKTIKIMPEFYQEPGKQRASD